MLAGLALSTLLITTRWCDLAERENLTRCQARQQIWVQASLTQAVIGAGLMAASAGFYVGGSLDASRRRKLAAPPLAVAVDAARTQPVPSRYEQHLPRS
jgi:hypothetical protein